MPGNTHVKEEQILLSKLDKGVRVVGRYEILQFLGKGAFGTVVACRDHYLGNTQVALKILSKSVCTSPRGRRRLAHEVRASHRINHDHVVKFYDLIQVGDFIAIVMEYVSGIKLRELIGQAPPLSYTNILELLRQICEGLKAVHAHQIIHRDLKPDNILISEDGIVKISDFGIASLSESNEETLPPPSSDGTHELLDSQTVGNTRVSYDTYLRYRPSNTPKVMGTLEYVAPESILCGTYDMRSDIYALGVIAYELITGRYIYNYQDQEQLLQLKISLDPPAPEQFRRDCPPALSDFCMKAMCRNPSQRYPNVEACLMALRVALQEKWSYERMCQKNFSVKEPLIENPFSRHPDAPHLPGLIHFFRRFFGDRKG